MRGSLNFIFLLLCISSRAQFAPQAGLQGSTAIHKDSNIFISWGDAPIIVRGWVHSLDTTQGKTTFGNAASGAGIADNNVVSLGDGGTATYFFPNPIINGPGPDFAVFENGFLSLTDSNLAFIELAFVEVSSNGTDFIRFHAESHLDTTVQIYGIGDFIDCRKINNLAGKYIAGYGTPFDLNELASYSNLDINNIRFIRTRDVVGSILPAFSSKDYMQRTINDPFPTNFHTGGFDLDAIGVIHQKYPVSVPNVFASEYSTLIYPNPCKEKIYFNTPDIERVELYNLLGEKKLSRTNLTNLYLDISSLPSSTYIVFVHKNNVIHKTLLQKQ